MRFLACILALLPGAVKAVPDSGKLGSESDPIRQALFASQSMKDLITHVQLNGEPGAFQKIADAYKAVNTGNKVEAVSLLRSGLTLPQLETREQLWLWAALRELGERPDAKTAYEVIGVVIEMPSGDGYDTLAAYQDGSARYLNFSGKAIFWDKKEDAGIRALCQGFIDSAVPSGNRAQPRTSLSLPKSGGQVTLLTRSGIYVVKNPPQPVINAGAGLMMELIKRTAESK